MFFYYDYERNEVNKLAELKFSHFFGNLVFCETNNSFYCIGVINSKKCEIYRNDEIINSNNSPSDKKNVQKMWESLPDLNVSRHECSSIFFNNFLFIFFGYNNLTNFNNNTVERMNILKNECWEILSYTNPSYLNVTLNSHSTIKYNDNEILLLFENYNISKLDINRIYRYLEKYTKENANEIEDEIIDDETEII